MLGAGLVCVDADVAVWGAGLMGLGFGGGFLGRFLGRWRGGAGVCGFMGEVGAHLCGFLP